MSTERVVETFFELVKIDSESNHEGKFQDYLIRKFKALGREVIEDNTKAETGLGANNVIARLPGNVEAEAMFFSCHIDTVPPGRNIQPVIRDKIIYSEGATILAADDKAGIAVMIELVELIRDKKMKHGTLEFVLTPGEEIGLVGVAALEMGLLVADFGFVLDSGGPVGSITVASPSLYGIEIAIKGQTAHAGLEPEKGVSAIEIASKAIAKMKLGRIDEETTANIGTIHGGVASNIVADDVKISAEARSISHEVCEAQVKHMIDLFENTARELGGSATATTDLKSKGYKLAKESKTVRLAAQAIKKIGRTPAYDISGGGSDANVFNAKGKETANLSIGYESVHTVHEHIPVSELEKSVELVCQLVMEIAEQS